MDRNCTVVLPGPSLARCGGSTFSVFMLVLEQFLRTQCDVEDPCGQIIPRDNPLPEYDFIVVGCGSAGSVLASRLSEVLEWDILCVEAGVNEPTGSQVPSFHSNALNTSIDWQYQAEPEPFSFLNKGFVTFPRGKVIGGTSVLSSMNYIRGNKKDYDQLEEAGNTGWSFRDVLPYFKKSENNLQIDSVDKGYHGVGGEMPISQFPYIFPFEEAILKGARELGQKIIDVNGDSQMGFANTQATYENGVRHSTARAFLRHVQKRENLHVMLNTLVEKVLIDIETKRAIGVVIIKEDGSKERIIAKKEVILCAGAIGSPKILLQSGVGDAELLKSVDVPIVHHLPGVGRNFHDQVGYWVKFTSNETNVRDLNWAGAVQYLLFRDGPMTTTGNSVIGFIQTKYGIQIANYPDVKLQFRGYQAKCSETGAISEIDGNVVNGNPPTRPFSMRSVLMQPKSRGYLTLRDNNPHSPPKIYPGYLSDLSDILHIIEGIRFQIKLSQTDALRKYGLELDRTPVDGCEDIMFGSDRYWKCAIIRDTNSLNHLAGTCKMGPEKDLEAVVNPQLLVRGMLGLRVADTSIFPKVQVGSTFAPTMMIAEKVADIIKTFYGITCIV